VLSYILRWLNWKKAIWIIIVFTVLYTGGSCETIMPTYEFECQTCMDRHEVIMKMTEYDAYPKVCSKDGGDLVQVYDNRETQNFILAGSGWTPRHSPVNAPDTRFKPKG
jgi:putative FmdB family regulatory protein